MRSCQEGWCYLSKKKKKIEEFSTAVSSTMVMFTHCGVIWSPGLKGSWTMCLVNHKRQNWCMHFMRQSGSENSWRSEHKCHTNWPKVLIVHCSHSCEIPKARFWPLLTASKGADQPQIFRGNFLLLQNIKFQPMQSSLPEVWRSQKSKQKLSQDICDSSDCHPLLCCTEYSRSTVEASQFQSLYLWGYCMHEVQSAYGMCKSHLRSLSSWMKTFTDSGDTEMVVEFAKTLKDSKLFSTALSWRIVMFTHWVRIVVSAGKVRTWFKLS